MDDGWVPSCGTAGHERHRVVRDGWRGKAPRRRQRWRCIGPDGQFHKLTPKVGRLEALTAACLDCENDLHASQGPGVARKYDYVAREVAAAMAALSRGATYIEASKSIRTSVAGSFRRAGRPLPWSDTGFAHGQLAATWVETYTDVVLGSDEDSSWPAVVLLDSTDFWRYFQGRKVPAFSLLCAYGYDIVEDSAGPASAGWTPAQRLARGLEPFAVASVEELLPDDMSDEELEVQHAWPEVRVTSTNGRLVKVWAASGKDERDWKQFLTSLPGRPQVVVCDGDQAIAKAAKAVWGTVEGGATSELVRCRQHLLNNLLGHVQADLVRSDTREVPPEQKVLDAREHWLYGRAKLAFDSAVQWHSYRELAYMALGTLYFGEKPSRGKGSKRGYKLIESETLRWLRANELTVLLQIARRPDRPGPESIGPLEGHIYKLRGRVAGRAQTLANRDRTQLLLRLLTAGQRAQVDEVEWAERVRQYLAALDGFAPEQRPLTMPKGTRTL